MSQFLDYRVNISGCALTIAPDAEKERCQQQNAAMKVLYDSGCRRLVAPKLLPITGDNEVYIIRGYLD